MGAEEETSPGTEVHFLFDFSSCNSTSGHWAGLEEKVVQQTHPHSGLADSSVWGPPPGLRPHVSPQTGLNGWRWENVLIASAAARRLTRGVGRRTAAEVRGCWILQPAAPRSRSASRGQEGPCGSEA